MVSVNFKKGFVIGAAILIVLIIVIIILILATRRPSTRSNSNCPTADPPEFITVTTGSELPFKAVVSWSAVPGATTYVVYRRSQPGVTSLDHDAKLFTTSTQVTFDNIVEPNQHFRISSFNECGEGTLSGEVQEVVNCVFEGPSNLDVQSINSSNAQASWNSVIGAIGYHMYVNSVKVFSGNITTASFGTPVPGNYSVEISTQNNCGEGPKSPAFILNVPVIFI